MFIDEVEITEGGDGYVLVFLDEKDLAIEAKN